MDKFDEGLYFQMEDRIIRNEYMAVQWHITNRCQEKCVHCYLKKEKVQDFPDEYIDLTLNKIYDLSLMIRKPVIIGLIGGDPLMHPKIWEIIDKIRSRGFHCRISGNPHLLDDETTKKLKENGIVAYQISIDGPEEINDEIRSKGHYKIAVQGLKTLKKYGITNCVKTVVSSMNIDHMEELAEEMMKLEVDDFNFCRFVPGSEEEKHYMESVTGEKYKEFLDKMYNKFKNSDSKTKLLVREHLFVPLFVEKGILPEMISKRVKYLSDKYNKDIQLDGCSMWGDMYTINADGKVNSCKKVPVEFGNIITDDFFQIRERKNEFLNSQEMEKCGKCRLKGLCRGCPAVSMGVNGSIYSEDPQCWL